MPNHLILVGWPTGNGNQVATSFRYSTYVHNDRSKFAYSNLYAEDTNHQQPTVEVPNLHRYILVLTKPIGSSYTDARTVSSSTTQHKTHSTLQQVSKTLSKDGLKAQKHPQIKQTQIPVSNNMTMVWASL